MPCSQPVKGPCFVHTPTCKGCSFELSPALEESLKTGKIRCPMCGSQCLTPDLEIDQKQGQQSIVGTPMIQTPNITSPQMQSSMMTTPQMPSQKVQQQAMQQIPQTPVLPDEDPEMRQYRLSFADALCSLLRPQTIEIDWSEVIFQPKSSEPLNNSPIEIPQNTEEYTKYVCSLW